MKSIWKICRTFFALSLSSFFFFLSLSLFHQTITSRIFYKTRQINRSKRRYYYISAIVNRQFLFAILLPSHRNVKCWNAIALRYISRILTPFIIYPPPSFSSFQTVSQKFNRFYFANDESSNLKPHSFDVSTSIFSCVLHLRSFGQHENDTLIVVPKLFWSTYKVVK